MHLSYGVHMLRCLLRSLSLLYTGGILMLNTILLGLLAIISGCTQAVTGFGAGIVNMVFMPGIIGMNPAAAVSTGAGFPLALNIARNYLKECRWKTIPAALIPYFVVGWFSVKASTTLDLSSLKAVFGLVLVVFGLYFLFFSEKLKIKAGIPAAVICGTLGGVINSFFGIGGPPLVVYFLAATDTKEEYLGTINVFFSVTALYLVIIKAMNGIITVDLIPKIISVIIGLLIGSTIGAKIIGRINIVLMKKIIYFFLIISGVITTVNALI